MGIGAVKLGGGNWSCNVRGVGIGAVMLGGVRFGVVMLGVGGNWSCNIRDGWELEL